jgi:hypothetical protein
MEIRTSNFFLLSLLFLLLLPPFHLFIIFSIMDLGEWFDKLSKKIANLLTNLYDIIIIIISNPIITGLLIYLCMSIA